MCHLAVAVFVIVLWRPTFRADLTTALGDHVTPCLGLVRGQQSILRESDRARPADAAGAMRAAAAHGQIQRALYRAPYLGLVPDQGADIDQFDAYGNWSMGERNQVMSQLKAGREVGFNSNETETSRKRAGSKRARYFVPSQKSGLSPGVYKRSGKNKLSKILHFTTAMPVYDNRLHFLDNVEDRFRMKLPDHLRRTFEKMAVRRGILPPL